MNHRIKASIACALCGPAAVGVLFAPAAFAATLPNLATSAAISVSTTGPADAQFSNMETTYSAPLTAPVGWRGFCRQIGRDITVTLPQTTDVQTVSIQFEQDASSGVYYPHQVDFEAYSGGQWYQVATEQSVVPITDKRVTTQTFTAHFSGLRTNEIRIHFPVSVWVFAHNLKVNGTPVPGAAPAVPSGASIVPSSGTQPMEAYDPRSRGIRNMLLVYTGDYQSLGTWSPSDFAPMVTYTNPNGQSLGPMFDTILFLPYGSLQDNQQSWQNYLTDLFTPGQQLDALNTAVGQRNQQLGTYGQQEKVVLTIPYPAFGDGAWGSANGQALLFNATAADPAALSAREAALQWYVQTLLADWNNAHYANLDLVGLYWDKEDVDYSSPGEVPLIQYASSLAHQAGYGFYWIPFYDASGLTEWQQLGFDGVWLQPNYAEQGNAADISRVANSDAYAKELGLGIELELSGGVQYPSVQTLYNQTIAQLETDGMADSVSHAYYAGSKDFVKSFLATDPNERAVYDETYSFMQHP